MRQCSILAARGKGHATAAGYVGVANTVGIGHLRQYRMGRDAQGFGQLHGDRGSRLTQASSANDRALSPERNSPESNSMSAAWHSQSVAARSLSFGNRTNPSLDLERNG